MCFQIIVNYGKLYVNKGKTMVLILSKGLMSKRKFLHNGVTIENVKFFCYLGIFFSRSGKFNYAKKHLAEQASNALYGVLRS